jgi:hypothetical protein
MPSASIAVQPRAGVPLPAQSARTIPVLALGMSLGVFLVISYTLCIVGYLVLRGLPINHAALAIFLPGFELLSWPSFFLGRSCAICCAPISATATPRSCKRRRRPSSSWPMIAVTGDTAVVETDDPAAGDGDAEHVARQILDATRARRARFQKIRRADLSNPRRIIAHASRPPTIHVFTQPGP